MNTERCTLAERRFLDAMKTSLSEAHGFCPVCGYDALSPVTPSLESALVDLTIEVGGKWAGRTVEWLGPVGGSNVI